MLMKFLKIWNVSLLNIQNKSLVAYMRDRVVLLKATLPKDLAQD